MDTTITGLPRPVCLFEKYEIVGLSNAPHCFIRYLKKKYPNYDTDPYGSILFGLFMRDEMGKDEYVSLITSGEWIQKEMECFQPGWGSHWLVTNVDTPLVAEEIKKAGGLLIRFNDGSWYDDPTGIDDYGGFDINIDFERRNVQDDDDETSQRIFEKINATIDRNTRKVDCDPGAVLILQECCTPEQWQELHKIRSRTPQQAMSDFLGIIRFNSNNIEIVPTVGHAAVQIKK